MESIAALEQVVGLLENAESLAGLADTDEQAIHRVELVEQLGRLVDGRRALAAANIADRSRKELGYDSLARRNGCTSGKQLLERLTRASATDIERRLRVGAAIRPRLTFDGQSLPSDRPELGAAVVGGSVGLDAAAIIIGFVSHARGANANLDTIDAAERGLIEQAKVASSDLVAVQTRVWRDFLDPDGVLPREENARERREITLGRDRNGLTLIRGWVESTAGALLKSAFDEATTPGAVPRFLSDDDRARGVEIGDTPDSGNLFVVRDPRTRGQIQHDVLVGLLKAGVGASALAPVGSRSNAAVTAVVLWRDLVAGAGPGWIDDIDESVSIQRIEELICANGLQALLLDGDGVPLKLGRKTRFFTDAQKKVLAALYGGCIINGCTAPPGWCDAHHVDEWEEDDGPTDVENGVLLCEVHHHWIHASDYKLSMIDGRPHLLAPYMVDPDQVWRPMGLSRAMIAAALSAEFAA